MLIQLDMNINDAEALLRHCTKHQPDFEDFRENARLREALETLAAAINDAMSPAQESLDSLEMIDPYLLDAAMALFGDKTSAVDWLSKPLRALGEKRPRDIPLEEALMLIGRLEHGFGA